MAYLSPPSLCLPAFAFSGSSHHAHPPPTRSSFISTLGIITSPAYSSWILSSNHGFLPHTPLRLLRHRLSPPSQRTLTPLPLLSTLQDKSAPASAHTADSQSQQPHTPSAVSKALKLPPVLPGALPVFGNFLTVLAESDKAGTRGFFDDLDTDIYRFQLFSIPIYAVRDRNAMELVLSSEDLFCKGPSFQQLSFAFGNGLFMVDEKDQHRRMRALLTPSFSPDFLKKLVPTFVDVSLQASQVLHDHLTKHPGVDVEISSMFKRMALDVIGVGGFDADFASVSKWQNLFEYRNVDQENDMSHLWDQLSRNALFIASNLPIPNRLLPGYDKCIYVVQKVQNLVVQIIHQRSKQQDITGNDILANLLRERRANNAPWLTDTMIRDECMSFLFAGSDTSAGVLMWLFYQLSQDRPMRERVEAEIHNVMLDRPIRSLNADDLKKLPILNACIYETLRLYPAVVGLGRQAKQNVNLLGYDIPQGQTVLVNFFALFRNKQLWDNPEQWIPDRWLTESPELAAHMKNLFMPFGIGPRACIGSRFALMEIASFAVVLVSEFTLKPAARPSDLTYGITVSSKSGVWIKLQPRER